MLELRDVCLRHPGAPTPILDHVDLACVTGVTWLVGRNAAGKTTLLRSIAGELAPERGAITLDGVPLRTRSTAGAVTYVPDDEALPDFLTVREVLHLAGRAAGVTLDGPALVGLLRRFDIDPSLGSVLVGALSFGTRRKVRTMIGLLATKRLVLLDEPFVGLDPHAVAAVVAVIRHLAEHDRIVVVSSHHLDVIDVLGGICWVVDEGRVERLAGGPGALAEWSWSLDRSVDAERSTAGLLAPALSDHRHG